VRGKRRRKEEEEEEESDAATRIGLLPSACRMLAEAELMLAICLLLCTTVLHVRSLGGEGEGDGNLAKYSFLSIRTSLRTPPSPPALVDVHCTCTSYFSILPCT